MKKISRIIFSVAIVSLLSNCDKIDDPINPITNESTGERKVIIEEFTGQLCTFCPDGAREIKRLDSIYGKNLITISIHAGPYADPNNGAPNDFSTDAGNTYNTTFGVSSYPAATVSRRNNANILGLSQWENELITVNEIEPEMDLSITTSYDSVNRKVDITVLTEWLKEGDADSKYNVQVYIIENNIIAGQLDNSVWIPNYTHEHMLRAVVNGTWGTELTNEYIKGVLEIKKFDYTLDSTWDANNCKVIAFVYKIGPDYEVMQANSLYVIPRGIINTT